MMVIFPFLLFVDTALNTYKNICRQYAYFYLLFESKKLNESLPDFMKTFCFEDYQYVFIYFAGLQFRYAGSMKILYI